MNQPVNGFGGIGLAGSVPSYTPERFKYQSVFDQANKGGFDPNGWRKGTFNSNSLNYLGGNNGGGLSTALVDNSMDMDAINKIIATDGTGGANTGIFGNMFSGENGFLSRDNEGLLGRDSLMGNNEQVGLIPAGAQLGALGLGAVNSFLQYGQAQDKFRHQKRVDNFNAYNSGTATNTQLENQHRARLGGTGNNNAAGNYKSLDNYKRDHSVRTSL